ncbi:MAG: histidine phosphatase family protein [Clostridiales bacterium]|nr:histidine phosphatase family protein [Clostridiales bacterium]
MTVLVIRHGESEADILNVHEGRADFELTERGQKQAAVMAKFVAQRYRITKIYASTLKRAAQTAKRLSDETGVGIEFDPDLMEFNNGLLAGLPYDEADRLYPKVKDLPVDRAVYGQESKKEFRGRAERVMGRLISENASDDVIAVVTHGGMINQLYGTLLHTPVGDSSFFCTSDTGIHVWEVTEQGTYVVKANMDGHIKDI